MAEIMPDAAHSLRTAGGGASTPMALYAADVRHCTISEMVTQTLQVGSSAGGQYLNTVPVAIYDMRGNGNRQTAPTLLRCSDCDRPTDYTAAVDHGGGSEKWVVRRLTPLECLRLQGFPDTWLDGVTLRGKPLADSHKYKLAGNSWAVNCAAFIADRIRAWDRLYVPRMQAAADEIDAAGLVWWSTSEWGIAGFQDDEVPIGVLFVDDDGYRVINRDGRTPPGFDMLPVTLAECLAMIATSSAEMAA
jgi:hypothetical protein